MPNNKEFIDGLHRFMARPETIGFQLGIDLQAHPLAIKNHLRRNQHADEKLKWEIKSLIKQAEQATNDYPDEDDRWINRLHDEAFQSAAHSMAAVGMLAPFVEALFARIFGCIRDKRLCDLPAQENEETYWNWKRGGLCVGLKRLADSTGLAGFLPDDYHKTVGALIRYRNVMFHNGFEWPKKECKEFQEAMKKWPEGWFESASQNGFFKSGVEENLHPDTRRFDMQDDFIEHCLDTIDKVIDGFGKFLRNR